MVKVVWLESLSVDGGEWGTLAGGGGGSRGGVWERGIGATGPCLDREGPFVDRKVRGDKLAALVVFCFFLAWCWLCTMDDEERLVLLFCFSLFCCPQRAADALVLLPRVAFFVHSKAGAILIHDSRDFMKRELQVNLHLYVIRLYPLC